MSRSSSTIRVATLAALVLLSDRASAIDLSPNPFLLKGTGSGGGDIEASVRLVGTSTGVPPGGVTKFGSISPTDTSLIFRVRVHGGSAPVKYFLLGADTTYPPLPPMLSISGGGVIPGPDVDVEVALWPTDPSVYVTGLSENGVSNDFFISFPTAPAVGQFVLAGTNDEALGGPACGFTPCVQNHAVVVNDQPAVPASSASGVILLAGLLVSIAWVIGLRPGAAQARNRTRPVARS